MKIPSSRHIFCNKSADLKHKNGVNNKTNLFVTWPVFIIKLLNLFQSLLFLISRRSCPRNKTDLWWNEWIYITVFFLFVTYFKSNYLNGQALMAYK